MGQPRPQSSLASFDVSFDMTSAVKLVGRTHPGRLAIKGKFKMAEQGQVSNLSQRKRQPHFVSTFYNAPQVFGRIVFKLYIRNIPWSSKKKAGFRRSVSGTFSRWIGTFLPFCASPSCYRAWSQAFSCYSDSGNWPGDEAVYGAKWQPSPGFAEFFVKFHKSWQKGYNCFALKCIWSKKQV